MSTTALSPLKDFFFELYGEEIPARFQGHAAQQCHDAFIQTCRDFSIEAQDTAVFITPQRIVIKGMLATHTPSQVVERRGPRLGCPDKALEGFCTSAGCNRSDLLEKEGYYWARAHISEKSVASLLEEVMTRTLTTITWPKTMRWPQSPTAWVRPVRGHYGCFDERMLDIPLSIFGLSAPKLPTGHRFLAPQTFSPLSFDAYERGLEERYVVLNQNVRQEIIVKKLNEAAQAHHVTLVHDTKLLEEVTGLVEYPGVLMGHLDASLFKAPDEVIVTSMRFHQKCFAFKDNAGHLAPFFAAVVNTKPEKDCMVMQQGYENGMLKARLEDARFFYDMDVKKPLEEHTKKYKTVIFHEKLGTLQDKIDRMMSAAPFMDAHMKNVLSPAPLMSSVLRAIMLSKADLFTEVVGEFDELQGLMGSLYAKKQGEAEEVAQALYDYYRPKGVEDNAPHASVSVMLALLDKFDTLVGFVGVGILPSSSKDPFGLRRTGLGILRTLIENKLDVSLLPIIENTCTSYQMCKTTLQQDTIKQVLAFLQNRLGFFLQSQACSPEVVRASLPSSGSDFSPFMCTLTALALRDFLQSKDGELLLASFKRASRMLSTEIKKDKGDCVWHTHIQLLEVEQKLVDTLHTLENTLSSVPYEKCQQLRTLAKPIDDFFDGALINDPVAQVRENRLIILKRVVALFERVANFQELEGV